MGGHNLFKSVTGHWPIPYEEEEKGLKLLRKAQHPHYEIKAYSCKLKGLGTRVPSEPKTTNRNTCTSL
jgi:hypothetical protein